MNAQDLISRINELKNSIRPSEDARRSFLEKFPEESLSKMDETQYAGGKESNGFCYNIEYVRALPFGIKGRGKNKFGYVAGEGRGKFIKVRDALVSVLKAAKTNDFDSIDSNANSSQISNAVLIKILAIYNPDKYITIGQDYTLTLLSLILNVNTANKSLVEINHLCLIRLCELEPSFANLGFNVLGCCIWQILSPKYLEGFKDWIKIQHPEKSSVSIYPTRLVNLCYFYKENYLGNNDTEVLRNLYDDTKKYQQAQGGQYYGEKKSYGTAEYYSAAVGKYIEYVSSAGKNLRLTNDLTDHDSIIASKLVFSVSTIISVIKRTGLFINDRDIKRLCFSLMTKRFVILSGLSGSGKTQLALALSHAICEDANKQICFIPVGADWTNREPLLGYPNALDDAKYFIPENSAIPLLVEAQKPENQDKPFFLILDEMNLSVVERYFADFLSAMETSERSINLWRKTNDKSPDRGVPSTLILGNNVFIIGTINVDETTYMFSPKVLDRANVIEFKITAEEMSQYLESDSSINIGLADGAAASCAAEFVSDIKVARRNEINTVLSNFFVSLKKLNAEFGYRSANEIYKFIGIALEKDDSEKKMTLDQAIDSAIVQKLLPKLHGSKTKLSPVLKEMWRLCFKDAKPQTELEDAKTGDDGKPIYPLTADKIFRMYKWAFDNGFASFAEA